MYISVIFYNSLVCVEFSGQIDHSKSIACNEYSGIKRHLILIMLPWLRVGVNKRFVGLFNCLF